MSHGEIINCVGSGEGGRRFIFPAKSSVVVKTFATGQGSISGMYSSIFSILIAKRLSAIEP